ncbi:hypothetical protein ACH3WN_32040 [Streptomyces albogriseolus]|uniref:hypothetical protein n=1 Tax=Streptomyces albogriseolus TaxID=1887 RepID=UPI0037BDD1AE
MPEPAGSGPGGLLAVAPDARPWAVPPERPAGGPTGAGDGDGDAVDAAAYERFRTTVTVEDPHAPQPR